MSGPNPVIYLNGEFLPTEQGCVSVLDRGFLLGDGVYEVIPVYGGRPFRLHQHLSRLERSLSAVRIPNPLDRDSWADVIGALIEHNGGGDQSIYLQVTRGVAGKRDHAFPEGVQPTVLLMSSPLGGPDGAVTASGIAAVTLEDIRWQRCDIKAITLLANVLLRQQALDADATEAILVSDGQASEGAASNLFVVHDGQVVTPPKGVHLLPGITRDLVLELAAAEGLPCEERPVTVEELHRADEIWLTSSTREILPVTRLDGRPVGDGQPGPVWARMHACYQRYKDRLRRGQGS